MQNPLFTDGVNSLSAYPQSDRKSPAALGAFVFPPLLHLLHLHSGSLVVLVIAFSMPFGYTCLAISGKENSTMPATRNLCAQLPLDLHQRVCEAREESGLTTAQYITNLLLEYYEMKENGGNAAMTNGKNRTLAFQIDEELFQRIKAHLERESARLGRKVTQREFVLNAIIGVLNMSEPMDVDEAGVSPCEAGSEDGSAQPQEEDTPAV